MREINPFHVLVADADEIADSLRSEALVAVMVIRLNHCYSIPLEFVVDT